MKRPPPIPQTPSESPPPEPREIRPCDIVERVSAARPSQRIARPARVAQPPRKG